VQCGEGLIGEREFDRFCSEERTGLIYSGGFIGIIVYIIWVKYLVKHAWGAVHALGCPVVYTVTLCVCIYVCECVCVCVCV
jgi:hypothetical protein